MTSNCRYKWTAENAPDKGSTQVFSVSRNEHPRFVGRFTADFSENAARLEVFIDEVTWIDEPGPIAPDILCESQLAFVVKLNEVYSLLFGEQERPAWIPESEERCYQ